MARIRKSRREKPAVPAAHDIDFGHFWRQLRAAGWKSKRPSGLQTEWSYSSPDNAYVFVGESAVVDYAFDTGLLEEEVADDQVRVEDDEELYQEEVASGGEEQQHKADDDVRPSQIDTSVHLSQNTMDQLFGPPSDDDIELSQATVMRAFGHFQGDLHVDDEEQGAAAGLHLLSEASGLESEGELNDKQAEAPAPRRQTPMQVKDDINIVLDGEDSGDYENLSSGVTDDDGICDDDSDLGCDELDEDDDVLSDSDAVEIDEAFYRPLQVGNNALSRAAVKDREEALRAMQWTPVASEYETDTPAYPGLGTEEARLVGELLDVWRSPILTLFYYMHKSLWVMIAAETNRYGLQQVKKRAEAIHLRQSEGRRETVKHIAQRLKAQQAYTTHEILHIVGLLIARMLCPQKRRFSAHWSMVEDGAIPAGVSGDT